MGSTFMEVLQLLLAEATTIWLGIKVAIELGLKSSEGEGTNKNIIELIQGETKTLSPIQGII